MSDSHPSIAHSGTLRVFDAEETAALLDYTALMRALETASLEYGRGEIVSPERQVVPLANHGVMLSMPACASDIAIHKLVNVNPGNPASGLPTIHGQVTVYDTPTGRPLFILDGPTVTARRTAVITALGIRALSPIPPSNVLLIGTGKQATGHLHALSHLFPGLRFWIRASRLQSAERFCQANAAPDLDLRPCPEGGIPDEIDVAITLTTSKTPVYTETAKPARLVIGVGAFQAESAEIAASTVQASQCFVDDVAGARHEAGDLINAGVDWGTVRPLSHALMHRPDSTRPVLYKTVGCAAWDLAAARVAKARLGL